MAAIVFASNDSQSRPETITVGPLIINPYLRKVTVNGSTVYLTNKEYRLLRVLASEPQRCFTRAELYQRVWNISQRLPTRTLDRHAATLRQKLGGPFVINEWGVGYRLIDPDPDEF